MKIKINFEIVKTSLFDGKNYLERLTSYVYEINYDALVSNKNETIFIDFDVETDHLYYDFYI